MREEGPTADPSALACGRPHAKGRDDNWLGAGAGITSQQRASLGRRGFPVSLEARFPGQKSGASTEGQSTAGMASRSRRRRRK